MMWPLFIPILLLAVLFGAVLMSSNRRGAKFVMLTMLGLLLVATAMFGVRLRSDFGPGGPPVARRGPMPPNYYDAQLDLQQRGMRSMTIPAQTSQPWTIETDAPATQSAQSQRSSQLWVADWQAYRNNTNFNGFRVESSDTSPTAQASLEEARRQAVSELQRMLLSDPRVSRAMGNLRMSRPVLTQRIEAEIRTGSMVVGQSVHSIDKSYGTLWKTYLLIDTSPGAMNRLVGQITRDANLQRRQVFTTAGSLAALMLVIVLLYAFLNTVTKGYFVWKLRAAVILVLIAGVLVFCATV